MNFDDYLRDEAAKYRQLAEDADDSSTPPALPLMAEPSKGSDLFARGSDIRFGGFDGEVGFLREGHIPRARV